MVVREEEEDKENPSSPLLQGEVGAGAGAGIGARKRRR